MPDSVPGPRPNPSFTPREARPVDPGLEHLSAQAENAAEALANVADLEAQFLARYQQVQALATEKGATYSIPSVGSERIKVFPAFDPQAEQTTLAVRQTLDQFRIQTQSLQTALARVIPAVPESPPVAPTPLVAPPLPATPAPAPPYPGVPTPPPLPAAPPDLEPPPVPASALPTLPNVPPPTPEMVARWQEHTNATGQAYNLPGYGKLTPQTPPVPPPAATPSAPSPLAARLQASQRQQAPATPVVPPVGLPQPELGGLAARMLQTAPQATPALPGGLAARMMALAPPVANLPEAIPVPPSAGSSPLAGRLAGPLQAAQRRAQQAANEALARQAQEAIEQAQEEERQQQAEAQRHAQRAAYQGLQTPLARAAYESRRRAEMGAEAEQYQQAQRAGAIEGQVIGGPESQALTRAQVEAQEQARTNQMRQQAQAARARAAYLETPEGRQQARQQQDAQRQQQEALEIQRRRENVDQYGRLGAALREAREHLTDFAGVVSTVGGTVTSVFSVIQGLAGAASPQAGATFSRSVDLLMARAGRSSVPVLNTASGLVQEAARNFDNLSLGAAAFNILPVPRPRREGTEPPSRGFGQTFLDTLTFGLTAKDRPPPLQSFEGLPPGGYALGPEQYYERIQQAGMNVSPIDAATLMEQLQNTVGLLERVVDNTGNLRNLIPTWRY